LCHFSEQPYLSIQSEIILQPLDKYTGNSVWDQRSNYIWHGATVYTLQESARRMVLADMPPDQDDAHEAADRLLAARPQSRLSRPSSLRVISI